MLRLRRLFISVIILFFPLITIAGIDIYPEKIAKFKEFKAFKDIYKKIYEDANNEDSKVIVMRVNEHEKDFKYKSNDEKRENEKEWLQKTLDLGEIDSYCNLKVPELTYEEEFSSDLYVEHSIMLKSLCEYERGLLRLQNDLARKNSFQSMFSNESRKESPFDIIEDFHNIDEIFYGEKFIDQKPPAPEFLQYKYDKQNESNKTENEKINHSGFHPKTEGWQDQREGKGISNTVLGMKDYGDIKSSIVGNIAGLWEPLDEMGGYSTLGEKVSTGYFENTGHPEGGSSGSTPKKSNAGGFDSSIPPPDKTEPAYKTVMNESIGDDYQGLINDILNKSSCPELYVSGDLLNTDDMNKRRECEFERDWEFETSLENFKKKTAFLIENEHYGKNGISRIFKSLTKFNKSLDAFEDYVVYIEKLIFDFVSYNIQK